MPAIWAVKVVTLTLTHPVLTERDNFHPYKQEALLYYTYLSARRDSGEVHEDGGDGGGDVEERQQEATVVLLRGVPAHCPHAKLALLSQLTFYCHF